MKKSELISIMTLAYANLPPNSSPKVVAKEMLRVAEKHGMLPPHTVKTVVKDGWYLDKNAPGKITVECSRLEWDDAEEDWG